MTLKKDGNFGNLFNNKSRVAYTHSGVFHADDVCSTALLKIVFPDMEIRRVSKVPKDAEFAFDIGLGKYDHHQPDAEERTDGSLYAAFGLLWRDIGHRIMSQHDADIFDRCFVRGIDYTDTTGKPNPFSSIINAFNPSWDEDKSSDEAFWEAVEFATVALKKQFERVKSSEKAEKVVRDIIANKECYPTEHSLRLEFYLPYQRETCKKNIWYVTFPSNRDIGYWNICTVPISMEEPTSQRAPLLEEWVNGEKPKGCSFVHPAKFLACFEDYESAVNALEILEKRYESENLSYPKA